MHDVANGLKVKGYNIKDDVEIFNHLENSFAEPILLNINTVENFGMQEQVLMAIILIDMKKRWNSSVMKEKR